MKQRIIPILISLMLFLGGNFVTKVSANSTDMELLESRKDTITNIYDGKAFVYNLDGEDITSEFINKYYENYLAGDLLSIAQDLGKEEISVLIFDVEENEILAALPNFKTNFYSWKLYGEGFDVHLKVVGRIDLDAQNRIISYDDHLKTSIISSNGVKVVEHGIDLNWSEVYPGLTSVEYIERSYFKLADGRYRYQPGKVCLTVVATGTQPKATYCGDW